jgi:hypothetical protein
MFKSSDINGKHKITIINVSYSNLDLIRNEKPTLSHHSKKQKMPNICNNAIQVCYKDRAVIWDLDSNVELRTLVNIREFTDVDTFTRTGFMYHTETDFEDRLFYNDL